MNKKKLNWILGVLEDLEWIEGPCGYDACPICFQLAPTEIKNAKHLDSCRLVRAMTDIRAELKNHGTD